MLLQRTTAAAAFAGLFLLAWLAPANAVPQWVPVPIMKSAAISGNTHDGDPQRGKLIYRKCQACHDTASHNGHGIGPSLAGLIGRPAAAHKRFSYSSAMRTAGKQGLIWSRDFLTEYLEQPTKFLPGGAMAFVGIESEDDRDDLIAYLATIKAPEDAPWLLANLNKVDIPLPVQHPLNR